MLKPSKTCSTNSTRAAAAQVTTSESHALPCDELILFWTTALGQDEVTRTLTEMNAAFNAVTVAETALETATNAQVQLASQEYQLLRSGACGWIQTDVAYQTALATYNTAVTTLATARTTYTLSVTAHTEAVTEAARLKLECECATQSAHAAAWADANADNNANDAAWAQAHHIDCVIEHISEVNCAFGPAPGLTQPTLCDDIESVSCAAESGSAAPVAPTAAFPAQDPSDPGLSCTAPSTCVFPFTYYGVEYNACTSIGKGGVGVWGECWCSTATATVGVPEMVPGSGDWVACQSR